MGSLLPGAHRHLAFLWGSYDNSSGCGHLQSAHDDKEYLRIHLVDIHGAVWFVIDWTGTLLVYS